MPAEALHPGPAPAGPAPGAAPATEGRLPARAVACLIAFAMIVPVLWGSSTKPHASFMHQLVCVLAWCGVLMLLPRAQPDLAARSRRNLPLAAALAALGLCWLAAAAQGFTGRAAELLVMGLGLLLMLSAARQGRPEQALTPLAWGLWLGGLFSVGVIGHQHFFPCRGDGHILALNLTGRAYGNLRQPNLMATYLVLALLAGGWLASQGRLGAQAGMRRALALVGGLGLVLALAMTASRTGLLVLLLLPAWAAFDRRLPRGLRLALGSTPLVYALAFALLSVAPRMAPPATCKPLPPVGSLARQQALADRHAAQASATATPSARAAAPAGAASADEAAEDEAAFAEGEAAEAPGFIGTQRLQITGDISSGRRGIWADALRLIREQPLSGVGWNRFNLAWTLSPGMQWRGGLLTHAHNLPLHLAAELGLPLAGTVLGLLAWALWRGSRLMPRSPAATVAALMLAALLLHSLLEYPLWYAYFLLPACWLLGALLGPLGLAPQALPADPAGAAAQASVAVPTPAPRAWGLRANLGLLAALAALAGWRDYRLLEPILTIQDPKARLEAVRQAERGPIYGHYASYLLLKHPRAVPQPVQFSVALSQGLDVRLLRAYAIALARAGRLDDATYVSQRLREFDWREDVQRMFAACATAEAGRHFYCRREPLPGPWRRALP
ncbi:O-antigen ligase family protein [Piscinibacter sp. Jin2]|uniref:O-antigen ligase family protein n=1 Tax=Aquariibacter lacus TaxID=2801332 RepID=A0A9X0XCL2_9BURK|nr:O-antigen ligase family protein [Piscinibacter lacus]MBL0719249.1 O-antigen ligase family protein [Piscinibacter lacus]